MKQLQEKLANSVRKVKTQQAEKTQTKKTTTKKTKPAVVESSAPLLPSKRIWPD